MSTRLLSALLLAGLALGTLGFVLERSATNRSGCQNGCSAYERVVLEGFRAVFLVSMIVAGVLLARVIRERGRNAA